MDQYCFCRSISKCSSHHNEYSHQKIEDSLPSNYTEAIVTYDETPQVKPALERRRKNPIPDISEKISKLYLKLQKKSDIVIQPRNKGKRGLHNGLSRRRSTFVGVSKNGSHWQTLINFGKTKKYIGTF